MVPIKAFYRCALPVPFLVAFPAFAEVCDKERPGWTGEKIGMLGELANFLISYLGAFTVLIVIGAIITRWIWFLVFAALLNLTLASGFVADWFSPFEFRSAAVSEGCIGSPALIVALTVITFLSLWVLAIRSRRSNGNH